MVREADIQLAGGRALHVYDTAVEGAETGVAIVWHHGTPNIGEPPAPLLAPAAERGLRWVSYDRPGYGGSTARPGRDIASAAADVAAVADALGIEQFALMGHSGGSPHALACAALLPERVIAAVCVAGLAPLGAEGIDWFAGMTDYGAGQLRAAVAGRAVLERYLASTEWDPQQFTPADHAALADEWGWVGRVAAKAMEGGPAVSIDDELAYVAPWGFDPRAVSAPVLVVHGGEDRVVPSSHGEWLTRQIESAELWLRPDDGHISILNSAMAALDWLGQHAGARRTS